MDNVFKIDLNEGHSVKVRLQLVTDLFSTASFNIEWNSAWKYEVNNLLPNLNAAYLIDLGNHLSHVFFGTRAIGNVNRGQSTLADRGLLGNV
jgi:hypothetical protein